MKYYTRLKQYKASNVIYDTTTEIATSYEWYWIAKRINGVMVVNDYRYSPTTARHVRIIEDLFDELGIKYINIKAPKGLQSLESALEYYKGKIEDLYLAIDKPRSRKKTNNDRITEIPQHTDKIKLVNDLMRTN